MMWKFIYNDQYGLFNDILCRIGVIDSYKAWLSTADGSFMALVITDIWKTAPYMALLILAGLQMVPDEMYEAAKIRRCECNTKIPLCNAAYSKNNSSCCAFVPYSGRIPCI